MTRQRGGTKRSSWLTFRRRLVLVRTLLRGSTTRDELIAVVQQEMGANGYPQHAESALKHDMRALKSEYNCQIRFQRNPSRYTITDLGELALLDVPDVCLEALAFLEASFPAGSALPEHANIRTLLDHILMLLPPSRQQHHQAQRHSITMRLAASSSTKIDATVMATVRRASEQGQELAFDYRSNTEDQRIMHYRVAPYGVFFGPEEHGYLDATLLEETPPTTRLRPYEVIHFRLNRIVKGSTTILPTRLPPERVAPPTYALRYWLAPEVARRRDVAAYFPNTSINYQDDGSAMVTATVTNLWQTRQILLRYGMACVVQEPAELVAMVRETIRGMAHLYGCNEPAEEV